MDYFTWQGGIGLEFGNENMSVGVNYTLQAGQNSTGHGVFGMFRYEFYIRRISGRETHLSAAFEQKAGTPLRSGGRLFQVRGDEKLLLRRTRHACCHSAHPLGEARKHAAFPGQRAAFFAARSLSVRAEAEATAASGAACRQLSAGRRLLFCRLLPFCAQTLCPQKNFRQKRNFFLTKRIGLYKVPSCVDQFGLSFNWQDVGFWLR